MPAGVTSVRVRAEGGGDGAVVTATVKVTPGQVLGVIAGCADGGGYRWGAPGGQALDAQCADGAPGGGSSAVLTASFDERIVEAGGGGGAGGSCAGSTGGAGGPGSQLGENGQPGPAPQAAKGGNGGTRIAGHGDNGRDGRGTTGAGGGGGGAGCRGGAGGFGGVNKAGGGGGGGSSCTGALALRPTYGTGGRGKVVISPDHLAVVNSGSDVLDANGNGRQDIGDQIDYVATVRNDGAVPVHGVTLAATLGGTTLPMTCDLSSTLAPGASGTCSTRHTLTAADVNRRSLPFAATASATSDSGEALTAGATRTLALRPVPGMVVAVAAPVTDTNGNGRTDAGDVIGYTATVTNTGSGAINQLAAGSLACQRTSLATGESADCTATHVIGQDDVDGAGVVAANVTVTGRSVESGQSLAEGPFAANTRLDQVATLAVTNTVDSVRDENGNGRTDAGDEIDYRVEATNTGTVTLTGVTTTEPDCDRADLAPGATITCTSTYRIGQADADRGSVTRAASATALFQGHSVLSNEATAVTEVPMVAGLTADAVTTVTDTNGNGHTDAGDVIEYRVTVGNGGTVTMTGVAVTLGATQADCATTTLLPGESTGCTASYLITQADVDRGTPIEVTGLATASTPAGPASATVGPLRTALTTFLALIVTNQTDVRDTNGNGLKDTGDVLAYQVTVTNYSTVTLSEVTPVLVGLTLDCAPQSLAPGASIHCAAEHVVSQADVDRGSVRHDATASGIAPAGDPVLAEVSPSETALDQRATLSVAINAAKAGDVITYTVTVANTGTVTLTNVTTTVTGCAPADLAPGGTITCTTTHAVTSADKQAGTVVTTVKATGRTPSGADVTAEATAQTAVSPAPQGKAAPVQEEELAWTGVTAVEEMLIAGAVLLVAGLGLLVFVVRRRRD